MSQATSFALFITLSLAGPMLVRSAPVDRDNGNPRPTNLKADEEIVFYPTYGFHDSQTKRWRLTIHGKVFEPETGSIKRKILLRLLRTGLNETGNLGDQLREDRVRHFLVDNERGKSVTVTLADRQWNLGKSSANGHFRSELTLDATRLDLDPANESQVNFLAVLRDSDARSFGGHVRLLANRGISIISDLDDTIKDSNVSDRTELIRNTFMRDFRPVAGMSPIYQSLAELGVSFHYVSASPWQLFGPLETFLHDFGFPSGTMHLKLFSVKDSLKSKLLRSPRESKLNAIRPLLNDFPDRRFVLIGDSGEKDPEIYGTIAREHPHQVLGIYIRNLNESVRTDERFTNAFHGIPPERWQLFGHADDLQRSLVPLLRDRFHEIEQ